MNKLDIENEDSISIVDQIIKEEGQIWDRKDFYFNSSNDVDDSSPSTIIFPKLECESVPLENDCNLREFQISVEEETKDVILQSVGETCSKIGDGKSLISLENYVHVDYSFPNTSVCRVKSECESVPSVDNSDIEELHALVEEENKDDVLQGIDETRVKIWNREDSSFLDDCIKMEVHQNGLSEEKQSIPEIHFEHCQAEPDKCDYSLTKKNDIKKRVGNVRRRAKLHKCGLCDYNTARKSTLKDHIDGVHLHIKPHKCHVCDYSSTQKANLKRHIDGVHGQDEYNKCDYSANKNNDNKCGVPKQAKIHKCDLCGYSATQKSSFKRHLDGVHRQVKPYKCDFCDHSTTTKSDIKKHINGVHLQVRPHKCHLCDYRATLRNRLKRHIAGVHTQTKLYKCDLCDYGANQKCHLTYHIDGVHQQTKSNKCDFCDYRVTQKSNLKRHIDSVHWQAKPYKCNFCDYNASRKSNLKVHIDAIHLNAKRHKCEFCDYNTTRKSDLKVHTDAVHLHVKPHKCSECDYSTTIKGSLKKHLDRNHR